MGSAALKTGTDTGRSTVKLPYLPALDGLRGLALIAILLTHGGVSQVRGGHLALTAFFTLSGFLITGLLLVERHRTGTVDLKVFWARRARRLVPALLLTFPLVAVVVLLAESPPGEGLLLDAVAAATWVANWRFVFAEQTYADLYALPSPFQHFWSLAVEEQFYLVFPLVLLAVLGVRSARARTGRLALLLGLLVVLSTVQVVRLHADGGVLGRAYYGTDARLAEILVGSLLALAMVGPRGLRPMSRPVRAAVGALGTAGLVGLLGLMLTLEKDADLTYRGGFLAAALCTAAVVAAGVVPGSPVTRLLSWRPLVWLGLVSYGVYLFHWPLFLLLTEPATGLDGVALLALRFAVVIGLAWLSLVLLERPVRSGGLPALPALGSWATGTAAGVVLVVAASATITLAPAPVLVQQATAATAPVPPPATADELRDPLGGSPPSAAPTAEQVQPREAQAPSPAAQALATAPAPAPKTAAPQQPVVQGIPKAFTEPPKDVVVPPPAPPPPAGQPEALRVAIVGDSIAGDLGEGLERWAVGRTEVVPLSFAVGGCPISRGGQRRVSPDKHFPIIEECDWWSQPDSERFRDFVRFDPHLVIIEAGIDEVFERRPDGWDDWHAPGSPELDSWMVSEYKAAVSALSAGGARVALMNTPCADFSRQPTLREMEDDVNPRAHTVNTSVYLRVTGVDRIDLMGRVCPGGQYQHDVEGVEGGRFDGLHFTEPAADALARNWLGPIVLEAAAARPVG